MIININPYIVTNGNGQEAVKFYEKAVDAKVLGVQTFADLPEEQQAHLPPGAKERVIHAHLQIGESNLMISDTFPGPHQEEYIIGSQVTIAINVNNDQKSKEIFESLATDGYIIKPLQETFFSSSYGQVRDKFGVTWHVSTHA